MNIKKLLFKLIPTKTNKRKFYVSVIDSIETIEQDFNSPVKALHSVVGALYDCIVNIPMTVYSDFNHYKLINVNLFTKSSQEASQFVSWVLENNMRFLSFIKDHDTLENRVFIDWFSNPESLREYLDKGLDLISAYLYYHTSSADGEGTPTEMAMYFDYVDFKLFIVEYFTVVKIVLETNVRNLE